ncbi:MAG TPA: ribonuclease H-like domain-containing protein [Thermaerobacter sp.]
MSRLEELRALHAQGRLVLKARGAKEEAVPKGTVPSAAAAADGVADGLAPPGAGPTDGAVSAAGAAPAAALPAAGTAAAVPAAGGSAPAAGGPSGPFTPVETVAGTAWCWRTVYPPAFAHGRGSPAAWYRDLQRSLGVLAAVAGPVRSRQPAPSAVEQLLFLDLETTGLAVGAGHRPFLAGLAWFDVDREGAGAPERDPGGGGGTPRGAGGSGAAAAEPGFAGAAGPVLVVEQYLVPDLEPETEQAWLAAIARRLAEHPWLVTFNGRGFDWPMLETRWRWHRRAAPEPAAHLDLLYPARRLWAGPAQRVNLRALESRLLGVLRQGDVPGAEIPGRFARFLRQRQGPRPDGPTARPLDPAATTDAPNPRHGGAADPASRGPTPSAGREAPEALGPLRPVLRHNLVDLLSLVGIAARLGGWLAAGPLGALRWDEALAAGREWERIDPEVAARWYERALTLARGRGPVTAVARRLVPLYRRQRRWGDAAAVQAALCDAHHPLAPVEPWLDLADLWLRMEERERAAACLAQAERLWERRRRLPLAGPQSRVERRIARLRQRLAEGDDGSQARAL